MRGVWLRGGRGSQGLRGGVCGGLSCAAPVYHLVCCNLWGSRSNYISLSACVNTRRWAEDSAGRSVFWGLSTRVSVCVGERRQTTLALDLLSAGNFLALSHPTALLPAPTSAEDRRRVFACACAATFFNAEADKSLCLRLPNASSKLGSCRERVGERESRPRPEREGCCLRRVPERARRHVWKRALRRRRP